MKVKSSENDQNIVFSENYYYIEKCIYMRPEETPAEEIYI